MDFCEDSDLVEGLVLDRKEGFDDLDERVNNVGKKGASAKARKAVSTGKQ
jgi:hypothetical protein